jgi:putative SOS response-associated peptidase YedK
MCGRYEVHTPVEEIARRFDAALAGQAAGLAPRYNVAPSLGFPAVRMRDGERELTAFTWGLLPSWSKDLSGTKPINARAETIFEKPMFRTAIRRRRCLIPANGFYEWQQRPGAKQPWHVGMADGSLFAFGGIWEYWAKQGAAPVVSCAIIVTGANELMRTIHECMPVIVAPEDYARWLSDELQDPVEIGEMLVPYPAEEMRAYPVSTRVNSVKNDGPELIQRLAEE